MVYKDIENYWDKIIFKCLVEFIGKLCGILLVDIKIVFDFI